MAKSPHADREERILQSWKDKEIFRKSLEKDAPKGEFVFYEGPPTANGHPGIHHLEARAFKDAIPRYRTMRGYHVRRKGGWDTHGLPVELQVEKELGLKSKKEIETYGIAAFNEKCKSSVWTYVHEWEDFTRRMGYWVDLKDPYVTYRPDYIESVWNVIKTADKKGLLYKDYKVVPWCPRCGTGLSSHELAQGYQDVKDLSVYVKFKIKGKVNEYLLAWTTTPWTLPGNAGLAVGEKIDYVQIQEISHSGDENFNPTITLGDLCYLAKEIFDREAYPFKDKDNHFNFKGKTVIKTGVVLKGSNLIGLEYEPLYPFLKDSVSGAEKDKLKNAFKVYAADFVTTADGTGIVHIAPMYGQDDFELGTKVGLPKYHLVADDGTFKKEAGFLAGRFVKEKNESGKPTLAVDIMNNLDERKLLFSHENHPHSYPFCWRCKTPLIYFARDSWYIRMSDLRHQLVKENEGIHWEPDHIKEGRFGEWLREVKDWAISRERYWGTPLPVWSCDKCGKRKVVGSVAEVSAKPKNEYYVIRHGEAENNTMGVLSGDPERPHHLTAKGKEQVARSAEALKDVKFDLMVVSPFVRTRDTAEIIRARLGLKADQIIVDERLRELRSGAWDGKPVKDFFKEFPHDARFERGPEGGENYCQIKQRVGDFLYDLEKRYAGKTILIVTHETPAYLMFAAAHGLNRERSLALRPGETFVENAEWHKLDFSILPHNPEYELDLHRPYIDEFSVQCACGGEMKRAKEVMDVWLDSGAMPFAQDHYPFEGKKDLLGLFGGQQKLAYPADFISEAIDQTRGWFYTLHAIGAIMGKGKAFKNVICLGHILDGEGKKMSKSVGNIVDPFALMDKYGADALRFWMYSVNQPGDSKNFDEKTVDEIIKKVFNLAANVTTFYKTYADEAGDMKTWIGTQSQSALDLWILARMNQLVSTVTVGLDAYAFLEPTRAIRDFVADLSQWYLRRSRERFKEGGVAQKEALATTRNILITLAKIMAPFTPFFAEEIYQQVGGELESVHLEDWPTGGKVDAKLLKDMETVRAICSKGLEARTNAKFNVRQPLASFSTTAAMLALGLADIIKDELNVKAVNFGAAEDKLDLNITSSLKEEGDLRELLRKIQDMRKEKGLTVKDKAVFVVTDDLKILVTKYETDIKEATNLSAIEFGAVLGLK